MKSRSRELLDRAIAATVAAIEVYNKPDFKYREETFATLAINGWELLLKAKWLADHNNKINSLYVMEPRKKTDGTNSKLMKIKTTRSGNAFTHSLDYLAKQLVATGDLHGSVWANMQALIEIRDSSIHFYNHGGSFSVRLQELGTASLRNFVGVTDSWFDRNLNEYNFYLMPLSFISLPYHSDGVILNQDECRFLDFVNALEAQHGDGDSEYSIAVNIEIRLTRSKVKEALGVNVTNDPNAPAVQLTPELMSDRYPWDYGRLTSECQKRYSDFKVTKQYHEIRKQLLGDPRWGTIRYLDPSNTKSSKKPFFSPNILSQFDGHYSRRKK